MRIAIYYESRLGRNDGPPLYWYNALKDMGHDVVHLAPIHPISKNFGNFDLHLWVDWGEDGLTGVLPYEPMDMSQYHPSVYVTSDTHLGFDYRLKKAKEFDYVFCNQKRAVEEFRAGGVEAEWLPHAVEPKAYPAEPACIKKYDVGFVGYVTFEKRVKMLDRIFKEFPNFWFGQRLFEEAAEIYRKSRVVINTAADDDINMRVFEVCATGSAMVTEFVPTLWELDHIKDDAVRPFLVYQDIDQAIDRIRELLVDDHARSYRGKRAKEWVLQGHTYQHRVKEMLNVTQIGNIYGCQNGVNDGQENLPKVSKHCTEAC